MIKTFTQNDLIRFLYNETSKKETKEIHKALLCDSELRQQYAELTAQKNQLDEGLLQPSPVSIANILHYSKSLQENV
jgi:hypothetical protein